MSMKSSLKNPSPIKSLSSSVEQYAINKLGVTDAVEAVFKESKSSGLPGDGGGPQDAYRHILIAAELVRQKGEIEGPIWAKAHEIKNLVNQEQSEADSKMDDHNNAIGQEIGRKAKTWEDVVRMAREKIEEAALNGGDGKDGSALWHNKPEQPDWKPDFTGRPIAPNKKGGEEERDKGYQKPEEFEKPEETDPGPRSDAPEAGNRNPKAADTPEAKQMMARLSRGGETISEIVLKDPARVTKDELDRVIGADLYRNSRDPLFEPANKLSVNWFDRVYAGLKSNADEPIAQSRIAKRVTPSMTPDFEPVSDVAIRIGRDLIGFADGDGTDDIKPQIVRLQSAINDVTPWHDTLEPDGVFGPLTHDALRGVLAKSGLGPLQGAFAGN